MKAVTLNRNRDKLEFPALYEVPAEMR